MDITSNQIIMLLVIEVLYFLIQIAPRIGLPNYGIDTWRWILYANKIRENGFKLPRYIDHYIYKARYSYPPTFHFMLAAFPEKFILKNNHLISPIFAVVENILLFVFTLKITLNPETALIASLIHALTPANIVENNNLNTRSFGQVLHTAAFFVIMLVAFFNWSPFWCLIPFGLVMISHRFSLQTLLFSSIICDIYIGSPVISLMLILSIPFTIVLTLGHYYIVLKAHLTQVKYWYGQIIKNYTLINIPPLSFFKSILSRNLFVLALFYPVIFITKDINTFLYLYIISIFVASVAITFVKPFRAIGDGYRYIGYITPAISLSLALTDMPLIYLTPLVIGNFVVITYKALQLRRASVGDMLSLRITPPLQELLNKLFLQENRSNFASFPPNLDDFVALNYPDVKVMFHDNGLALEGNIEPVFSGFLPKAEQIQPRLEANQIEIFLSSVDFGDMINYDKSVFESMFLYLRRTE